MPNKKKTPAKSHQKAEEETVVTQSLNNTSLQRTFENRFNCIVCWCPSLEMVYGRCQHKMCVACCYDEQTGFILIKKGRCPTCQKDYQFPLLRPIIPEDNMEHQKCLGVCSCPNDCGIYLWQWEVEEHLRQCPNKTAEPETTVTVSTLLKTPKTRGQKRKSGVMSPSPDILSPRRTRSMHKTDSQSRYELHT